MTTWDNSDINAGYPKWDASRGLKHILYSINGVSGDTGGTLTTTLGHLEHANVFVQIDTGPAGYATGLIWHISGKTVVVAYTDPQDGHTVHIEVWGK